ncbi:hypothetical protein O9992_12215 [Vibrio lentus]|nr:hypothetical protein [Vibrio lentus]
MTEILHHEASADTNIAINQGGWRRSVNLPICWFDEDDGSKNGIDSTNARGYP